MITVTLRFYEELNDFLPLDKRKKDISHTVAPRTAIKDVIESLSVPHTEIDLILVNGKSIGFTYQVQQNDYISVYPVFESLDISKVTRLRPAPLRKTKFILDVHLGKLARYLRLLGFDVFYASHLPDSTIVEHSFSEKRIVLTRDVGLLKNKKITHGYWIRNTNPDKQAVEVLNRFDLYDRVKPFTRCLECNGLLKKVAKSIIEKSLPPMTAQYYKDFMQCNNCKKIYWEGTHYRKLSTWVEKILPTNKKM